MRTYFSFSLLVHSVASVALFAVSVPVFLQGINQLDIIAKSPQLNQMYPNVLKLTQGIDQLQMVHSYGLFRSMTGVGGRPEIVLEGAHKTSGPWKEYNFLYKPGNVSEPLLPFVLPHQPRLDWQMWFAALGSYQRNPWLISLVYRLMQGKYKLTLKVPVFLESVQCHDTSKVNLHYPLTKCWTAYFQSLFCFKHF